MMDGWLREYQLSSRPSGEKAVTLTGQLEQMQVALCERKAGEKALILRMQLRWAEK